jgi:hypothetical protein
MTKCLFFILIRILSSGAELIVATTHLKSKLEFAAMRVKQGHDLLSWLKVIAAGNYLSV